MTARSYLYVPGDTEDRLARAHQREADALIVDLEDAVAPARKEAARRAVGQYLLAGADSVQVWVRINQGALGLADLRAIVTASLTGVCVPKVGSVTELQAVDHALSAAERAAHLPDRSVAVCPLIESAQGVAALTDIAGSPRVRQLQVGEMDLAADLRVDASPGGTELLVVRSLVVLASRATGLPSPVGAVSTNFRDLGAFREDTVALRKLGFGSRACVHPAQVSVVNEVFTPTMEELEHAAELIRVYDEALRHGRGVAVDRDGRMLDEAAIRSARDTLERGRDRRRTGPRDGG